jgi:hypothetical protein
MRLGAWRGALLLAALAWWAIIVVPFIKYPANPPAVGDPETIGYRQSLYITMLLLSASGTALVVGLSIRAAAAPATLGGSVRRACACRRSARACVAKQPRCCDCANHADQQLTGAFDHRVDVVLGDLRHDIRLAHTA